MAIEPSLNSMYHSADHLWWRTSGPALLVASVTPAWRLADQATDWAVLGWRFQLPLFVGHHTKQPTGSTLRARIYAHVVYGSGGVVGSRTRPPAAAGGGLQQRVEAQAARHMQAAASSPVSAMERSRRPPAGQRAVLGFWGGAIEARRPSRLRRNRMANDDSSRARSMHALSTCAPTDRRRSLGAAGIKTARHKGETSSRNRAAIALPPRENRRPTPSDV
jgi:hypothetical protein